MPYGRPFPTRLADTALARRGLFHFGPHCVQIVGGRDHREQQNECTAKRIDRHQRARRRTYYSTIPVCRRAPSPPQQIGRQQQRQPTKIEKKLHCETAKFSGRLHHQHHPVQVPQGNQGSTETAVKLHLGFTNAATDPAQFAKAARFAVFGEGWRAGMGFRRWHRRGPRKRQEAGHCQMKSQRW